MNVLVVGATGALGRPLVPLLAASGHEVVATSRSGRMATPKGSVAVALDLLDREAVERVVAEHRPDVVVHLATSIPHRIDPRRIGRQFAVTNRLRTEGTRHLVDAATSVGARILVEGVAYAYEPGPGLRRETDSLWSSPPKAYAPVAAALREMESLAADAGGTVLRFGHLYGPGTVYASDGSSTELVRRGKLPIVGEGAARYSFVHTDDAATAVLAALDAPPASVYNVVDDEPLALRDWLPWFAEQLGAPAPKRLPVALARLAVGPFGVAFMNELAAASNAAARDELQWRPRFPSFRSGIASDFRSADVA